MRMPHRLQRLEAGARQTLQARGDFAADPGMRWIGGVGGG